LVIWYLSKQLSGDDDVFYLFLQKQKIVFVTINVSLCLIKLSLPVRIAGVDGMTVHHRFKGPLTPFVRPVIW